MPKNLMQLSLNSLFNSSFIFISQILESKFGLQIFLVMDMQIDLKCTTMALQNPFLGMIPNDVLVMVCKQDAQGPSIRHALFMVLGHEFLRNDKRYHVSIDITSHFLTSLLNLGGNQVDIMMLLRNILKEKLLEDDVKILLLVE